MQISVIPKVIFVHPLFVLSIRHFLLNNSLFNINTRYNYTVQVFHEETGNIARFRGKWNNYTNRESLFIEMKSSINNDRSINKSIFWLGIFGVILQKHPQSRLFVFLKFGVTVSGCSQRPWTQRPWIHRRERLALLPIDHVHFVNSKCDLVHSLSILAGNIFCTGHMRKLTYFCVIIST